MKKRQPKKIVSPQNSVLPSSEELELNFKSFKSMGKIRSIKRGSTLSNAGKNIMEGQSILK
jgi:hypothetical protein